jgi:Bacterial regulatory helix-turn-helix protein, lysR family
MVGWSRPRWLRVSPSDVLCLPWRRVWLGGNRQPDGICPAMPFTTRRSSSVIASVISRHVTRAVEDVGLSQPAMSHVLARLRLVLDDDLLVRGPSGFALTPPRGGNRTPRNRDPERRASNLALPPSSATRMPSPKSRWRRVEASSRRWLQSRSAFPSQPSLPPSSTGAAKEQGKKQTWVSWSKHSSTDRRRRRPNRTGRELSNGDVRRGRSWTSSSLVRAPAGLVFSLSLPSFAVKSLAPWSDAPGHAPGRCHAQHNSFSRNWRQHRPCPTRSWLGEVAALIEPNDVERILADIDAHRGDGRN